MEIERITQTLKNIEDKIESTMGEIVYFYSPEQTSMYEPQRLFQEIGQLRHAKQIIQEYYNVSESGNPEF